MTLCAKVDKSGFETGLYPRNFTLVDARFFLLTSAIFDIQVVQALPVDQSDTQLFRLGGVD